MACIHTYNTGSGFGALFGRVGTAVQHGPWPIFSPTPPSVGVHMYYFRLVGLPQGIESTARSEKM
jgi:hypothetical protein